MTHSEMANLNIPEFETRKTEHIKLALEPRNQAIELSDLEKIHLIHRGLIHLDFKDVSIETLGFQTKRPAKPFFIAGMTAGHSGAIQVNQVLSKIAATRGWILGIGSQRRDLGDGLTEEVKSWQVIREQNPDLILLSNIGASQIVETPVSQIRDLVRRVGAQALAIHFNSLQEVIQPEGTPHFKGVFEALKRLVDQVGIPVLVKETGCGFSREALMEFQPIGLAAIDLSGLGGTHWGRIEGDRAGQSSSQVSETFRNWGESTVDSLLSAVEVFEPRTASVELWASGGVRTGLDAAKLIAIGAKRVGYAKPALEAVLAGLDNGVEEACESLHQWAERIEKELKIALFCMGLSGPDQLQGNRTKWKMKY